MNAVSRLSVSFLVGQLVGLLGWIDPLFLPLVLVGPPVTGALAARAGYRAAWGAVLWLSAGLCMLWTDWLVNREDVVFHAVVAGVTAVLALAGHGLTVLLGRSKRGSRVSA